MIRCEKDFPGTSRETFSSLLIINLNTMNKVFNFINSKNINTKINNIYNKYIYYSAIKLVIDT